MRTIYKHALWLSVLSLLLTLLPAAATAAPLPQLTADEVPTTATPLADGATGELITAAGVLPSNLYDPDSIGWASIRGLSSSAFSDHFNAMKDDYLMMDIEVDEIDGEQRVSAVWQRNVNNRGWAEHRNLNSTQFHDKWTTYKNQGYRLIDQESYTLNGNRYYAGIWVQNSENLAWASYRNLTSAQFSEKFAQFRDAGYLMVDVEGYSTGSGLRYAMIWVKNSENLGWAEYRNLSSAEFAEKFDELKATHRVWDVESYRHNGTQYYAGIWIENKNNRGWAEYRDMSATGYRNRWYRMRDLGYRLIDFEIYPTANGERYAGVWRQNNDRPNWPLRKDVDELAQNHLDTFNVPGLSVAIAKAGEIQYMRGFGFQEVDEGVWYSARTLNRLASVAKTVGAVLTLRLWQDGLIDDLDDASGDVLATLPNHHTHTVRQLMANRAGIGHYPAYNVPIQQYNSALAAAQTFWNTDSNPNQRGTQLVYPPGTDCIYSTHAHTILGAVLEAATGDTISALVEDQLSAPHGLPTLQVESRNDGDANRSAVYNSNNVDVAADNISWKVLGGGLESSAYDLLRFGMKTLNGTILNAASLAEMQLAPNPVPCNDPNWGNMGNYALGLQVGTQKGTTVLWKGGNQLGANTHIRLYPDEEMVIVVLANRNENHSTAALARDIGDLMLDAEAAAGDSDGGYEFDGLMHRTLGAVQAFYNQAKELVLTDFGGRGGSGIVTELDGVARWQGTFEIHADLQAAAPLQMQLTAKLSNGEPAATLNLQGAPEQLAATANFGTRAFAVQYLLDNTILDEVTPDGQGTQQAMINWDEIWCLLELPSNVPSEICRLTIEYYQNQSGGFEWNIKFANALTRAGSNGSTQQFNRVRLVAPSDPATNVAAAGTATFGELELRATNAELITLKAVESGGPATVPTAPTVALDNQIYLPLVLR